MDNSLSSRLSQAKSSTTAHQPAAIQTERPCNSHLRQGDRIYKISLNPKPRFKKSSMHLFVTCLLVSLAAVTALNNGLARTPPMGFLSWERFRCNIDCKDNPDTCISEKLYMTMADLLVSEGFRDLGYVYVNIDDCWPSKSRDAHGNLVPDPDRFPSGIHNLAKYMHSRGLKLGIYGDVGTKTCAGYPGSQNYITQDANTFASWELDLLKFDGCNSDPEHTNLDYPAMSNALNLTGRPILYSCEWAVHEPNKTREMYEKNKLYCNTWRNDHDIQDEWSSVTNIFNFYVANEGNFSDVAGPGGFNDPDMLVVGDFGLTYDQQKAQFGMWAIFAAPLYISADLRTMRPEFKAILQNTGVIAINQDMMGKQGTYLTTLSKIIQVWRRPLMTPESWAIAFLSTAYSATPTMLSVSPTQMGLTNRFGYNVTDVFENVNVGSYKLSDKLKLAVNPNGIVLLKAMPL